MHPYDPDVVRMMLMMVGSVPIVLYYVIRRYHQGKPLIDPSLRMLAVTWAILVLVFGEQLLVTFGNLSPEADRQLAPSHSPAHLCRGDHLLVLRAQASVAAGARPYIQDLAERLRIIPAAG
jgi:hypothetical protein